MKFDKFIPDLDSSVISTEPEIELNQLFQYSGETVSTGRVFEGVVKAGRLSSPKCHCPMSVNFVHQPECAWANPAPPPPNVWGIPRPPEPAPTLSSNFYRTNSDWGFAASTESGFQAVITDSGPTGPLNLNTLREFLIAKSKENK